MVVPAIDDHEVVLGLDPYDVSLGRFLSAQGHKPKLIATHFVAPFRKSRGAKNDRNDAEAILAAVRQPDMRFVSVKSLEQQAMLAWHRTRSGHCVERTALLNRTRGLLAEFGVWLGRSSAVLIRHLPQRCEDPRLPMNGGHGTVMGRRALGPSVFSTPWSYVDHLLLMPGSSSGMSRIADMSQAYYVMSGDGMVTVDGETAAIHAGDAIPVDLGQSKSFTVTGNAPLELLVFGSARDMKTKEAFAADPANAN